MKTLNVTVKNILLLLNLLIAPLSIFAICNTSVTITGKTFICFNVPDTLTARVSNGRAPYSYQWEFGGSDSVDIVPDGGLYAVTVTDANSCTASATIEINSNPQIYYSALYTLLGCDTPPSALVQINGEGGTGHFTYKLMGGATDTTGTFKDLPTGNYIITITDSVGCFFNDTFQIPKFISSFSLNVRTDSVRCVGADDGRIIITPLPPEYGPYQYSVDYGSFQTDSIFTNLAAGNHLVTVLSLVADACKPDTTVTVPNTTAICTGISNLNGEAKMDLYPNPATNLLVLSLQNFSNENAALEIYNELGQRVYGKSLSAGETMQQINVSGFANGFYTVMIKSNGAVAASSKFSKL